MLYGEGEQGQLNLFSKRLPVRRMNNSLSPWTELNPCQPETKRNDSAPTQKLLQLKSFCQAFSKKPRSPFPRLLHSLHFVRPACAVHAC